MCGKVKNLLSSKKRKKKTRQINFLVKTLSTYTKFLSKEAKKKKNSVKLVNLILNVTKDKTCSNEIVPPNLKKKTLSIRPK